MEKEETNQESWIQHKDREMKLFTSLFPEISEDEIRDHVERKFGMMNFSKDKFGIVSFRYGDYCKFLEDKIVNYLDLSRLEIEDVKEIYSIRIHNEGGMSILLEGWESGYGISLGGIDEKEMSDSQLSQILRILFYIKKGFSANMENIIYQLYRIEEEA